MSEDDAMTKPEPPRETIECDNPDCGCHGTLRTGFVCPRAIAPAPTPEPRPLDDVIALLREIRDKGWQFDRCHEAFSRIEKMAESALEKLGIKDGPPYPNPRTKGWWEKAGTPETPSCPTCGTKWTKETIDGVVHYHQGETPSALSAAPRADVIRLVAMLTFSNYTSAADYEAKLQQAIERVTPYFETYAATLREKLSTAERDYRIVRKEASEWMRRNAAAEAELARVTKIISEFLEHDGGEGSRCYDASVYRVSREKLRALQERERKGE